MAANPPNAATLARQRLNDIPDQEIRDSKRILIAMLDHLPHRGLTTFADEVNRCADNNELVQLSDHYVTTVFKPFKAAGGETPAPTPSPFFLDVGHEMEEVEERLSPSQVRRSTRDIERDCLHRDGYKCIVTRVWSYRAPDNLRPAGDLRALTKTCHIIPFALAHDGTSDQDLHNASSTWTSICRIFPGLWTRIANNLPDIDHPRNLFTAWIDVHQYFGNLDLALDPLGQNRYRLVRWDATNATVASLYFPQDNIIQLITANNAPLPDPYLFETHLAVARILHASGLAEILDEAIDDYRNLSELAADGSTNIPYVIERRDPVAV